MKTKPKFKCPFCGRIYLTSYLAQVCFDLDIKEAEAKEKQINKQKHLIN
jgi:hypothetical protein